MISFFPDNYHKAQLTSLFADEAPIIVPLEYSKFANVFFPEYATKLP